jgi:hypothetical protein
MKMRNRIQGSGASSPPRNRDLRDRCGSRGLCGARRRAAAAFVEVEYMVVVACVGIVVAIAIYKFGPGIVNNYHKQETIILQQGP